jgi:hypothetical protein
MGDETSTKMPGEIDIMDNDFSPSSFVRIGQSLEMPGEIDVEQECIDCITDWITQYIGESRMSYENGSGRLYHESSPIKTIRDLVTFNIKGMVLEWKKYGSTEERRNSYKKLLDTYHSLDYDVMTQQWEKYVIRDITVKKKSSGFESYETYDYGRNGSIFDAWKSNIVASYSNEDISRFLKRHSTHGTKFAWGRDNGYNNNIIRKYIKCYLDLYLAVFPEYSNIKPDFIGNNFIYGGSKRKNKKTKKRKNKKSTKSNNGKKSRQFTH